MDDYLQACLDSGIEQLVILGAGLDSRAYRFNGLIDHLNVYEVDNTLRFVVENSGEASSITFDYVYAFALTAAHKRGEIARMQRNGRFTIAPIYGIVHAAVRPSN